MNVHPFVPCSMELGMPTRDFFGESYNDTEYGKKKKKKNKLFYVHTFTNRHTCKRSHTHTYSHTLAGTPMFTHDIRTCNRKLSLFIDLAGNHPHSFRSNTHGRRRVKQQFILATNLCEDNFLGVREVLLNNIDVLYPNRLRF